MTTTSAASDTTERGRIIPFPARDDFGPDAVARAVARLRQTVAAGDGHAMLAAMRQAREWWDAYSAVDAAMGGDGCAAHLTRGWNELMKAVALAPARTLPGLVAKAQLMEWNLVGRHGDAGWEPELARTLAAGLAELAATEARA
jgi:hypothetical protein